MQEKILSVIIPTHNMEKYLEHCLQSLLIKKKEILEFVEVWIVDDDCSDSSMDIAHKFVVNYPSLYRIFVNPEGNYGTCHNKMFKKASGKYFLTLDADDWFDPIEFQNYLECLLSLKSFPELIICDFINVHETDGHKELVHCKDEHGNIFAMSDCLRNHGLYWIHSATYLTSILQDIELQPCCFTDVELNTYTLKHIKNVLILHTPFYQYRIGRTGQDTEAKSYINKVRIAEKIINRLANELDESAPESVVINQIDTVKELLKKYYYVCLFCRKQITDDAYKAFMEIDKKLRLKQPRLYAEILKFKIGRVLYVKLWNSSRLLFQAYKWYFIKYK
jgi:glycosyltransferase involved in cell wall biosynthesis